MDKLREQFLSPGLFCRLLLSSGKEISGFVKDYNENSIVIVQDDKEVFVSLSFVAAISNTPDKQDEEKALLEELPKEIKKTPKKKSIGTSFGRKWTDEELKELANDFLDGCKNKELAGKYNRINSTITQMRQGFECARGNVNEDTLTDIAKSWVSRFQETLGS